MFSIHLYCHTDFLCFITFVSSSTLTDNAKIYFIKKKKKYFSTGFNKTNYFKFKFGKKTITREVHVTL